MAEKIVFETFYVCVEKEKTRMGVTFPMLFGKGPARMSVLGCLVFGVVALGGLAARAETLTIDVDGYTNAVPLVLSETLTITGTGDGFVQTGAVSGTGDLRFSLPGKTAFLLAPNTSAGDLYVDLGTLTMTNAAALGTGTVYVNEEETAGIKALCLDNRSAGAAMTVANTLVLGDEASTGGAHRMLFRAGTFDVAGTLTAAGSKVTANESAHVHLRGGIDGSRLTLSPWSQSAFFVEDRPFALTEALVVDSQGDVHLNVAGATVPAVFGTEKARLVLGGENFYPAGAVFAAQPPRPEAHLVIDVAGHNQSLGAFVGEGGERSRLCTLMNAAPGTCPTVIVAQTCDNTTTNLRFKGTFNLVKTGEGRLTAASGLRGRLTVAAGTYALGRRANNGHFGSFAHDVVVEQNAVLDLCGQKAVCRALDVRGGAVINGTVLADRIVLSDNANVTATLVGCVEKAGTGTAVVRAGALGEGGTSVRYAPPDGTVLHFPFDGSLEEALNGPQGQMTPLAIAHGAPAWSPDGRRGGCIYFDGASSLEIDPFPSDVPVGGAPMTAAAWIKPTDGCAGSGGWLSYGDRASGRGCSLRLNGFNGIHWYANNNDVTARNMGTSLADGAWHYVAATFDGTTRKIYCDGAEVASSAQTLDVLPTLFMLGKTMHDAFFTGWVDDVLIVDRALAADEVRALYEAGGVPIEAAPEREVAVSAGTLALTPDCAVRYPFASAETLLADASGNGHDLVAGDGGGFSFSADSPFGADAQRGSLALDGQTWLTAAAFPSLPTGNQARTVACFLKVADGCGAEGAVLSWGNEDWDAGRYMNFALRSGTREMGLFPWGAENRVAFTPTNLLRTAWTSFAAVWDGGRIAYYTNGVQAVAPQIYRSGERTTPFLSTDSGGFKIGRSWYSADLSSFKGNLAELTVWSRCLDGEEIRAWHRAGGLASDGALDGRLAVAAGAVCRVVGGASLTLAGLGGAGTVEGNVTLKEGAVVRARDEGPVMVVGTLTFAGDGTVVLPAVETPAFARYPLFAATQFAGEGNLAAWRCANVPKGYKAAVEVRGGVVEAVVRGRGMAVFIR